ncbi:hypothetical protein PAECIP111893_00267 [Paenibacillus plantiphilus]|uniref:DUF3383 family protein n=1 Tax=Paenibacillus plantiphilus TaxID=2905650 RepID=A0ABN8FRK6_9BACL|nr:DUF3383 family protein [Paenibacillus plantiphilus]CAH1190307.1 hypothetical protein PAECIP111893_00267 [Paenibacillus plantiphilus]
MAKDVNVIIDIERPTPKLGFGKPLVLGASATGAAYKTYLDIEGVKADFASSTEEYKAAYALLNQGDDSPAEIAIMCRRTGGTEQTIAEVLTEAFTKDWYFLVSTTTDIEDIGDIADVVEQNDSRQFFTRSDDLVDVGVLRGAGYSRTTVIYHTDITKYPEAAWIGRAGSAPVGSVTWKFKGLTDIVPLDISGTELLAIHTAGANTYVVKAGKNQTSEGKTLSGEYIDIIHSKDYVKFNIEHGVQTLLNHAAKISYDDTGIAQIESVVRTVLQRAYIQGVIAADADGVALYGTTFKGRAEVDPADRAARTYNDGEFWFELAGAIHETTIHGLIRL